MSDFDIDSTIANLERKLGSSPIETSSSSSITRLGGFSGAKSAIISALLASATIYFMKPLWLYNIKYDDKQDKCQPKLKLMKTITTFLVLTFAYYMITKRIF
jgi:hypothetical protein